VLRFARLLQMKILRLLSRETSSGNFIPEIDGARSVAILSVLFFHLSGNFLYYSQGSFAVPDAFDLPGRVLAQGHLGVPLFFIISGFILGLPFASHYLRGGKDISLGGYFRRRLFRLEPPYLINLLSCFAIYTIAGRWSASDALPNLMASSCYLHNVAFGKMSLVNCVAWSLEIEVQFYILAPFLSAVFFAIPRASLRRAILVAAIVGATLASRQLKPEHPVLAMTLLNYIQYFLVGFLLVDIYLVEWKDFHARHLWVDVLGISAAAAAPLGLAYDIPHFELAMPLLLGMFVAAALRGAVLNSTFRLPWVYTIGGMCYTIYLYHFMIIGLLGHGRLFLFRGFWPNLMFTFAVAPTIVLAACSVLFVLFEKPFMRRNWHVAALARLPFVRSGRRGLDARHVAAANEDALDLDLRMQN
jgi:peptidoglycan/LPS O-acetylase OafA/YrhL